MGEDTITVGAVEQDRRVAEGDQEAQADGHRRDGAGNEKQQACS